jgi:hypothetical protein
MGSREPFRRKIRRIWIHRWPQFCWWVRFCIGVPAIQRWRRLVAWLPDRSRGVAVEDPPPPDVCVVPGVLHVHTTYSDGSGSIPHVATAAAEAGLQFVIVTDHDTLQPLTDGWEGYHGGCLVLVGSEVRVRGGHVLALDVPPDLRMGIIPAAEAVENIRQAGGISFFLPDEDLSLSPAQVLGARFAGMEVINLHNLARQVASLPAFIAFAIRYVTRGPMAAFGMLVARPDGEMATWDRLNRERAMPGIASVDAHSRIYIHPRHDLKIPTYTQSFRLVQTHLLLDSPLTGDVARDRSAVYRALAVGRTHLVYGDEGAQEIRFWAASSAAASGPGQHLPDEGGLTFFARSPVAKTLYRLYRSGELVAQQSGRCARFAGSGPGFYRLEVYRWRGRVGPLHFGVTPWLFTNCITVRASDASSTSVSSSAFGSTGPRG